MTKVAEGNTTACVCVTCEIACMIEWKGSGQQILSLQPWSDASRGVIEFKVQRFVGGGSTLPFRGFL